MKIPTRFEDLQRFEYESAWAYQESLLNKIVSEKEKQNGDKINYLLFCEHPHVFTLGKSGNVSNLLINNAELKKVNATFFKTNRGGDITYHGPGQIVGYPILDLEEIGIGIKKYVFLIEEAIICTMKTFGIECERLEGATGVWIDSKIPGKARKICAVGIRASHYVTMHGFALNVNTDLKYFSFINPCGFVDKSVTSMQKELGSEQSVEAVKNQLKIRISELLNLELL
jgi:lipoyl(octanoyl) transferase